jgi:hypothetical protein
MKQMACVLTAGVALLLGPAELARAQVAYTLEKVAGTGDAAPGGGVLDPHYTIDLDGAGNVVMNGWVSGQAAIVRRDGSALQVVVREGDPVPGFPGESFGFVEGPRFGSAGALFWSGGWNPEPGSNRGIFRRDAGGDAVIVAAGQPAPGGGSFAYAGPAAANASNELVFEAGFELTAGEHPPAFFLARASGIEPVVRSGDPAPPPLSGTLEYLGYQAGLAADGTVVFSTYREELASRAFFRRAPGGAVSPLLLPGEPAPIPGGGHFTLLYPMLDVNAPGDVVFFGYALPAGSDDEKSGLYVIGSAGLRRIVYEGDVLPGSGGRRFYGSAGHAPLAINGHGDVAFFARSIDGWEGVFVSRSGKLHRIASQGQAAPGMPGERFRYFDDVRINVAGEVAFSAATTTKNAVFLATPVAAEVPFAPPWAFAVLGIALAALGARRIRLQPRRSAA